MSVCQVDGCGRTVSKAGHTLCLDHWKAERNGQLKRCKGCQRWHARTGQFCAACEQALTGDDEGSGDMLSSTKIGKQFGLSPIKMNLILAELGWIEKYVKGWVPTDRGNALGANVREMKNGTPFVVWPESILENAALRASVAEQSGDSARPMSAAPRAESTSAKQAENGDFRSKYPATFRTQDGHMVRSRAEVLIDNWLYMQGLVHAYERRLPIEEECYCDFYLPRGKGVYIEYWGMEADPKYRDRQAAKQAIYGKHGLRLIELGDAEIERLDDVLPRMLLKFGIESA
jgi:hypothetical protein